MDHFAMLTPHQQLVESFFIVWTVLSIHF